MIALLLVKHKDNAQLPRMVDKVFCLPGEHASASCRIKTLHVQNSSKSLLTSNSFSRSNTWRRVRWDVAAKDLHIVLLARGQWQVTRLNINKALYHIVHLVSDFWSKATFLSSVLFYYMTKQGACKSGNSDGWPMKSWKLASSENTDPALILKKMIRSARTSRNTSFCAWVERKNLYHLSKGI